MKKIKGENGKRMATMVSDEMYEDLEVISRKTKYTKAEIHRTVIAKLTHKQDDKQEQIYNELVGDIKNGIPPKIIVFKPYKKVKPTIRDEFTNKLISRAVYIVEAPKDYDSPVYLKGNDISWIIRYYSDNTAAWEVPFKGNFAMNRALVVMEKIIRNHIRDKYNRLTINR